MAEQQLSVVMAWYGHVSLNTKLWSIAHLNALSGNPPSHPIFVVSQSINSCSESRNSSLFWIACRDSMDAMDENAQHEPQDCCSRIGFITLGTSRQSTSGPRCGDAFITSVFTDWSDSSEDEGEEGSSFKLVLRMNEDFVSTGREFVRYRLLNSSNV